MNSNDQVFFGGKYIHIMSYLDRFLFAKEDVNRPVSDLSGGEQARLLLAQLMLDQGNLLILDEPTNDLDIATLQVLEKNLADFNGGVLFTSHDRYFMQKVATSLLTFLGEEKKESNWMFFTDLNQALDHLEKFEEANKQKSKAAEAKKSAEQKTEQKQDFNQPQQKPKLSYKTVREIETLEKRIAEIENLLPTLTAELDNQYAAQTNYQELRPLIQKIEALQLELDESYQKLEKLID